MDSLENDDNFPFRSYNTQLYLLLLEFIWNNEVQGKLTLFINFDNIESLQTMILEM